jgi:hypothetical protein
VGFATPGLSHNRTPISLVIAGLDPAIQRFVAEINKALDARIKSAHDESGELRVNRRLQRGSYGS